MPFAAYTAAKTPNVFQWARKPPKLPLVILGSLGPRNSPLPEQHLDRFSFSCRAHERDQQIDRYTNRQTMLLLSIATGRI